MSIEDILAFNKPLNESATLSVNFLGIDISTLSTANASLNPLLWVLDSGASYHITFDMLYRAVVEKRDKDIEDGKYKSFPLLLFLIYFFVMLTNEVLKLLNRD
jgi:hypothetical protein